jgi:hypothetical protein
LLWPLRPHHKLSENRADVAAPTFLDESNGNSSASFQTVQAVNQSL